MEGWGGVKTGEEGREGVKTGVEGREGRCKDWGRG